VLAQITIVVEETKSAKSTESQEFLHTWLRKVTIKPTSMPTFEVLRLSSRTALIGQGAAFSASLDQQA
jgi:hypothetical protein